MDWSENRDFIIMLGTLMWTYLGGVVFAGQPELARANAPISMTAMVIYIFFAEWYSTYAASQYTAMRATIYPGQKTEYFFFNKDEKGFTMQLPNFPNWHVTQYPLAKKKKHPVYGDVSNIAIIYEGDIQKRLIEGKIKVNWAGTIVTHHGGSAVSLEVPEKEFQPVIYDQGEVTLCYFLGYGSGDTHIMSMEQRLQQSLIQSAMPTSNLTQHEAIRKLIVMINTLAQRNVQLQKGYIQAMTNESKYQTESIQKTGLLKTIQRHVEGLLKIVPFNRAQVIDYVQTWVLARGNIRSLGKSTSLFGRIPKWAIYIVGLGLVFGFLTVNPSFQQGFGQWVSVGTNQLFLLLIVAMILIVVYYLFHRRSGK